MIRRSAVDWLTDAGGFCVAREFTCQTFHELAIMLLGDACQLTAGQVWTIDGPSGSCKSTFGRVLQCACNSVGSTPTVISTDFFIKFDRDYRELVRPPHREWYDFDRLGGTVDFLRRNPGDVLKMTDLYSRATGERNREHDFVRLDGSGVVIEGMYASEFPANLAVFFICDEIVARLRTEARDRERHAIDREAASRRFELHNMNTFLDHCRTHLARSDVLVDTTDVDRLACYVRRTG